MLPRHRGATPVPAAILAGDRATGVTLMRMDEGLDTGPIVAQAGTPIAPRRDRARPGGPAGRDGRRPAGVVAGAVAQRRDPRAPAADGRCDADTAVAPRGRAHGPVAARRRARPPGARLPAVARLVRRDPQRAADGLDVEPGGRASTCRPGASARAAWRPATARSCSTRSSRPAAGGCRGSSTCAAGRGSSAATSCRPPDPLG